MLEEGDTVTAVGHSLGGHLAALAVRLFPDLFAQAVTFNAPGFDGVISDALTVSPSSSTPRADEDQDVEQLKLKSTTRKADVPTTLREGEQVISRNEIIFGPSVLTTYYWLEVDGYVGLS